MFLGSIIFTTNNIKHLFLEYLDFLPPFFSDFADFFIVIFLFQCFNSFYYCLRSRPVTPNVVRPSVRPLVSDNVENRGIMNDRVTK